MCISIINTSIYRSTYFLPMLWTLADLNFKWVICRHSNIFQSKQIHECACVLEHLCTSMHRCLPFLPVLRILTHLNIKWVIYRPLNIRQSKSSSRTCALISFCIYQWIAVYINYLCCEYKFINYMRFSISQLKWSTLACGCALVFLGILIDRFAYYLLKSFE
jgi:hypothetical protein